MPRPLVTFIYVVIAGYILLAPVALTIAGTSWSVHTHLIISDLYVPCCIVMAFAASDYHRHESRVGTALCLTLLILGVLLALGVRPVLVR